MKRIKDFSEFQEYLENKTTIYVLENSNIYEMYVDEKCEDNEVEEELWQLVSADENSDDYLRIIQEDLDTMFFIDAGDIKNYKLEDLISLIMEDIFLVLVNKLDKKFKSLKSKHEQKN